MSTDNLWFAAFAASFREHLRSQRGDILFTVCCARASRKLLCRVNDGSLCQHGCCTGLIHSRALAAPCPGGPSHCEARQSQMPKCERRLNPANALGCLVHMPVCVHVEGSTVEELCGMGFRLLGTAASVREFGVGSALGQRQLISHNQPAASVPIFKSRMSGYLTILWRLLQQIRLREHARVGFVTECHLCPGRYKVAGGGEQGGVSLLMLSLSSRIRFAEVAIACLPLACRNPLAQGCRGCALETPDMQHADLFCAVLWSIVRCSPANGNACRPAL
jgi:hypothetical protein